MWTSPGGDTKQFKSNEVTLKWSGQTHRKLVIIKDSQANLVENTIINLYNNTNFNYESTKFVLESNLKEAEFKRKEAKSEVGNLKENIQSLKYE